MKYVFSDLIDVVAVQRLTELFSNATGMVTAIADLDGTVITKSGWQEICTRFHRANPETKRRCIESDSVIANKLDTGQGCTIYKCRNGLIDAAAPIVVEGEHIANFFTGQFLFEPPDLAFFRGQARTFDFNETAYVRAAAKIPVMSQEKLKPFLSYFSEFAEMLAKMGLARLRQMQAQEAVHRSEALLKAIVEGTTDAVFAKDVCGRYLLFNTAAGRATGKEPGDVIGKDDTFLFPHDEAKTVMDGDRAVMEGGATRTGEETLTDGSGETVTYLATKGPLLDGEGNLMGLFGISRDISDRKRSEEAQRESEHKLRLAVEHAPATIAMFDREMRYIAHSRQWLANYSHLAGENLIGRCHYEVFPRIPERWREINRRCLAGETLKAVEEPLPRPDGTMCWMNWEVLPWYEHSGEIGGIVVLAEDVSRHKEAKIALEAAHDKLEERVRERTGELQRAYEKLRGEITQREQAEAQLRQAQKMQAIGTLAGGIAHDFNNMLAVIIGNAELAYDDMEGFEAPRRNIEQLLAASKRARDLIKQILAFSRKTEREKNPLRLRPLLEETMGLLRGSLPSTIRMELDVSAESDTVLGDPAQIQQVLMNLGTNAAYAMRTNGGALSIGLSDAIIEQGTPMPDSDIGAGAYLKLTVSDTGNGMDNDVIKRIFEPFFTTKEVGQGTGMGLSVAYGIVKGHGGTITVESAPGKGSTFTVLLPHAPEFEDGEDEEGDDVPRGREKVLLVDDEPLVVQAASRTLERLGYRVTTAVSGSDALAKSLEDPYCFDLVITDQTMPDLTGMELAARMLEARRDLPVILITGYSETVSAETIKCSGIKEFVMKPIVRKELAQTVRRVLDTRG